MGISNSLSFNFYFRHRVKKITRMSVSKSFIFIIFFSLFQLHIFAQSNKRMLSDKVNSKEYDELNPRISSDGKKLYFSRSNSPENIGGKEAGQDIWCSEKNEAGEWKQAENLGKPLNTIENNSIGGFNANATNVYLSNIYGNAKQGISCSSILNGKFSKPKPLFEKNEIADNGFLSFYVSPDEKCMVISMNTDPIHNEDLFVSIHLEGGWTKPKTLGKTINTNGLEIAPFLSSDNKTLFYATNGLKGFGDYDVYMSKRLDDSWTNWTTPVNLGPNINTAGFDAYFITDSSSTNAYFCSSEGPGKNSDVYSIPFSEIIQVNRKLDTVRLSTNMNKKIYGTIAQLLNKPDAKFFSGAKSMHTKSLLEITEQADFLDYVPQQGFIGNDTLRVEVCKSNERLKCDSLIVIVEIQKQSMVVRNIITDAVSQKPITAIVVLNNDTLIKLRKMESSIPFEFATELKPFKKNRITICQDGYMPQVFNFDLTDSLNSFMIENHVALKPLAIGGVIGLNNIFFETGKSIIKELSFDELDNLAASLTKNPKMKIFIAGHTDNRGNETANQKLSDERVQTVIKYLLNKNVNPNQVSGKGFGSTKPIDTNETEEGRNRNRRVDFTIQNL
jgi:outer membrane protein OmpA-like peptidoglycan-associated protein